MYGIIEDGEHLCIVEEVMQRSFRKWIEQNSTISLSSKVKIALELADAVIYLHSQTGSKPAILHGGIDQLFFFSFL